MCVLRQTPPPPCILAHDIEHKDERLELATCVKSLWLVAIIYRLNFRIIVIACVSSWDNKAYTRSKLTCVASISFSAPFQILIQGEWPFWAGPDGCFRAARKNEKERRHCCIFCQEYQCVFTEYKIPCKRDYYYIKNRSVCYHFTRIALFIGFLLSQPWTFLSFDIHISPHLPPKHLRGIRSHSTYHEKDGEMVAVNGKP